MFIVVDIGYIKGRKFLCWICGSSIRFKAKCHLYIARISAAPLTIITTGRSEYLASKQAQISWDSSSPLFDRRVIRNFSCSFSRLAQPASSSILKQLWQEEEEQKSLYIDIWIGLRLIILLENLQPQFARQKLYKSLIVPNICELHEQF